MKTLSIPFRPLSHHDRLDDLIQEIGDAKVVLLGEASHGTSEYYTWRARLSRRLIEEKGFRFVAVEGDWPDCYDVNRYIKGQTRQFQNAREALLTFDRWPTWMWANWEVVAFVEWMRKHNEGVPEDRRVGFYGLDVYSLWESLDEVVNHFADSHPQVLAWAQRAAECFSPFERSGQDYGFSAYLGLGDCEDRVVEMLSALINAPVKSPDNPEKHFNAIRNAAVALDAERYYRTMVRADEASWNVRDHHMAETLYALLDQEGASAKAIVWEHNTHVGDARATDMAASGMFNVGQLARERFDGDVYIVGFGSYQGSVIAGERWGAEMEKLPVPPAAPGSWEAMLHDAPPVDKLVFLRDLERLPEFERPIGHRAIGVVYHPRFDNPGNYVPSFLARRYDAFVFLEKTEAVHPLKSVIHASPEPPDTYPWGL